MPASLVYFPTASGTELAWQLILHGPTPDKMYLIVVGAGYAKVLYSRNLVIEEGPEGEVFGAPRTNSDTDPGVAHPDDGGVGIEHFTGWPFSPAGCDQPGYTGGVDCWVATPPTGVPPLTIGNNVVALGDKTGADWFTLFPDPSEPFGVGFSNIPPFTPTFDPTGLAHFDFGFTNSYKATGDFVGDVGTETDAAVTNLFYWDNVIHDWLYALGFDEAAGNFQDDNFGRGGVGGDPVIAGVSVGLRHQQRLHGHAAGRVPSVHGLLPGHRSAVQEGRLLL